MLETADEDRRRLLRLAGELNVLDSREELLEEDPHLQAGEVGAQAEVDSVGERELLVVRASHVESTRGSEDGFVPVRRQVGEVDGVAGWDRAGYNGAILRGGSDELLHRGHAFEVNHEAESAIRGWSRTNPLVAEFQRRVDQIREEVLVQAFVDVGIDKDEARVLARIGLTILVDTSRSRTRWIASGSTHCSRNTNAGWASPEMKGRVWTRASA